MKLSKIKILVYSLFVVLLLFVWLMVDVVKVSSTSMLPTYKDGDYLVSLNAKWFLPKPNDVVIFKQSGKLIIKRIAPIKSNRIYRYSEFSFSRDYLIEKNIIGVTEYVFPQKKQLVKGIKELKKYDHFIESETKKNLMFRNGAYYLGLKQINQYKFRDDFFFLEGDNREKSFDSRKFGVVPKKDIVSKIICKLW